MCVVDCVSSGVIVYMLNYVSVGGQHMLWIMCPEVTGCVVHPLGSLSGGLCVCRGHGVCGGLCVHGDHIVCG